MSGFAEHQKHMRPSSPPPRLEAAVTTTSPSRAKDEASSFRVPPLPAQRALASKDYVRHHLLSQGPAFVPEIKRHHGWLEESDGLVLLDLSGVPRGDFLLSAQTRLHATLLEAIRTLPDDKRTALLRKSMPYIDVPELHEIPKTLLESMSTLPEDVCDALRALPLPVLDRLSYKIRQRLWESNLSSFTEQIEPHVAQYERDPAVMRTLDEMPFKPITLKNRLALAPLKSLIEATQMSLTLYQHLSAMLRQRFAHSGVPQVCTLQADVLSGMRASAIEEKKSGGSSNLLVFVHSLPCASLPPSLMDLRAKFGTMEKTEQYSTDFADVKRRAAALKQSIKELTNTKSSDLGKKAMGLIGAKVFPQLKLKEQLQVREFAKPVWELYPATIERSAYTKKIKRPMDIATMESKLEHNAYSSTHELIADFELMYKNCKQYNELNPASFVQKLIADAKELFTVVAPALVNEAAQSLAPPQTQDTVSLIADAAMFLWDPTTFHALAKLLVDALDIEVVENKKLPRDSAAALDLLWLLELALDAREWARAATDKTSKQLLDAPSAARVRDVLPYLALLVFDGASTSDAMTLDLSALPLATDYIARECVLRYLLKRVRMGDGRQAPVLLGLVAPVAAGHLGFLRSLIGALQAAPRGTQALRRRALLEIFLPHVEANPRNQDAHVFFAQALLQDEGFESGDAELLHLAHRVLDGIDHAWYAASRCKRLYEKDFFGPKSPFAAQRANFSLPSQVSLRVGSPMSSMGSAGPTSASPGLVMSPPQSSVSPGVWSPPSQASSPSPPQSTQSAVSGGSVAVTEGDVVWE